MKSIKKTDVHYVVENLIKIMNEKKLKQVEFANLVEIPVAKLNKIFTGVQNLNMHDFSKIAKKIKMREIDILTFPKCFSEVIKTDDEIRAQITVELKKTLKDKVLTLVFGNENLNILNE